MTSCLLSIDFKIFFYLKVPITHGMLLTLWHTDTYPLISEDNYYSTSLR